MLLKNLKVTNIIGSFKEAQKLLIFAAAILLVPNIYIQYLKWNFVLKLVKANATAKETLYSLLVGFTFGFITPGRIGEFGRAFFIKDCPWMKVIGISFVDKFSSLSVILFSGAIGILTLIGKQLHFYALLPLIIFTIIALLLLRYILVHPELFRSFLYNINIILPFRDKVKLLISSFDNFHRKQAVKLLGMSVIFYFIILMQYFLLISAFEPIPIIGCFQAISSTFIVKSMLPISLGDLGIRESAAVFFLGKIGISKTSAFNASILIFTINILIPSIVGLFLVLKNKLINFYETVEKKN